MTTPAEAARRELLQSLVAERFGVPTRRPSRKRQAELWQTERRQILAAEANRELPLAVDEEYDR
jgi:hypothetical protein